MASVHQKLFAALVVAILAVSMSSSVAAGRILQESGITAKELDNLSAVVPQRRAIPQYAVTEVYKAYLENLAKKHASLALLDENKDETAEEEHIENVGHDEHLVEDGQVVVEDGQVVVEDEIAQQQNEAHVDEHQLQNAAP